MGGLSLNLPEQLAFYGSYHNHPLNQLIHFFCVPAIIWSLFVWISAAGPLTPVPPLPDLPAWLPLVWASALQPTNPAFLVAATYSAFYLLLDLFAGASWALVVGLPLAWSATVFAAAVPRSWALALGVHVLAWYLQIHPGHAVLERRKPALMDSLVQAFALAPLFVWFEALFLLGYRPGLREQLKRRVAELIAQMDARGSGGGGQQALTPVQQREAGSPPGGRPGRPRCQGAAARVPPVSPGSRQLQGHRARPGGVQPSSVGESVVGFQMTVDRARVGKREGGA